MSVGKKDTGRCQEIYAGPTFPGFHGTMCVLAKGHENQGDGCHVGRSQVGGQLSWFTPAQKLARAAALANANAKANAKAGGQ